ncbi:brain-specific serine protease 4 isoform X1 [Tetranychus urticae]|uniref:Peptidase S1 domain-containing protein n=1 Tax=Tetranychus urticae TaxID=32264 RepID=T1K6Y5_TETUR|nr:brain-specific serine protease 4 isoform X1 [Tetranychus urticae]
MTSQRSIETRSPGLIKYKNQRITLKHLLIVAFILNHIGLIHGTETDQDANFVTKALGNVVRLLPSMRIGSRFNQGCVGGTRCQFFLSCWMSGGSLGSSCGPLYTCCITPSSQDIQPAFFGPVVNDPYCGRSATRISRIVGGSDASFGQFPWLAFVQVGGSRCGGALVGQRHVVTAGHCVARSQQSPTSIRVTLGDYVLHSDIESLPHEIFTVTDVRLHPNFRFTPQADRYDVAVLVLDRPVQYRDNIKPICLPQKGANFLGRGAFVAGWGALQAGSKLRPKVLQHVNVPVIDNNVCEVWHRRRGINIRIHDEMMCAGYEFGGRDACQGDSGGPLMLNEYGVWYLIGIVSAGYSCAKQYQPGIYHRVSSSSDWISANIYQGKK